ncbi:MAG: hypothetical protein H0T69_15600 [Thermoleophilaceae bacterium]|nr:hypothetical protein [Thermoleophilaceae bacterium]
MNWGAAARRRGAELWLLLAVGLAAALPIVLAAGYAIVHDWTPLGDDAYIATRGFDVFTDRAPLVGQRSSGASGVLDETAYNLGPLLFWVMALPARLPDGVFMALLAGAINIASVVGAVALARRRGGLPLMFATAIVIALMLASLPAEAYSDVWNPSIPLMPLLLLVFLAWSIACGDYRLLPVAVLVASFEAQAHLTFVAPALGLMVGALACAALFRVKGQGLSRRLAIVTALVALACWSAPLIDQAVNRPGNFVLLVRSASADEPTLGADAGWRALVHAFGVRPWWLKNSPYPLERLGDLSVGPTKRAAASAVLLLAALVVVLFLGWRRRRVDVFAAAALALALCAAVAVAAASTPQNAAATVSYTLRWASPAGACVWLLLGWSILTLAPAPSRLLRAPRPRFAVAGGLAATVLVGAAIAIRENPPRSEPYEPMRAIIDRLDAELPSGGTTWVESVGTNETFGMDSGFLVGIVYWLRRTGRNVVTAPAVADRLSDAYGRGPYDRVLRLTVNVPPDPDARLVAQVRATDPLMQDAVPKRIVSVTLRPERGVAAAP